MPVESITTHVMPVTAVPNEAGQGTSNARGAESESFAQALRKPNAAKDSSTRESSDAKTVRQQTVHEERKLADGKANRETNSANVNDSTAGPTADGDGANADASASGSSQLEGDATENPVDTELEAAEVTLAADEIAIEASLLIAPFVPATLPADISPEATEEGVVEAVSPSAGLSGITPNDVADSTRTGVQYQPLVAAIPAGSVAASEAAAAEPVTVVDGEELTIADQRKGEQTLQPQNIVTVQESATTAETTPVIAAAASEPDAETATQQENTEVQAPIINASNSPTEPAPIAAAKSIAPVGDKKPARSSTSPAANEHFTEGDAAAVDSSADSSESTKSIPASAEPTSEEKTNDDEANSEQNSPANLAIGPVVSNSDLTPSPTTAVPDAVATNAPISQRLPPYVAASSHESRPREVPQVDANRFLQRVTRAFQAAEERGGEVRLRLSPPELGSLQLEVSIRDGVLTARVETETSSARTILMDNLPQLRERLAEQGMKIEKFDVDVFGRQSGNLPDAQQQAEEQNRQRARNANLRMNTDETTPRGVRSGPDSQGLNVLV